ncbi:MAG: hypothetical protein KF753_00165 [Caldilineaceae bacterium]|nr:hypothetical protein [Caldilineaceae bacterium]
MTYSPTDTIFDFRVADIAPERVQAWQERAEFLLDEAAAGAAAFQAVDDELRQDERLSETPLSLPPASPTTNTPTQAMDFGRLQSEISGLLDVEPEQVRVFPEAELPGISHRSGLPAGSNAYAPSLPQTTGQISEQPPASRFVDSGAQSRYLHTPSDNPPAQITSLLDRPAPVLGKVPAPAAPPISLTAGQIRFLDEEISALHGEVKRALATRRDVTGHALSLLREAREILLAEPHRLGRAEYNISQVRSMLERADESRRRSSRRGFRVLLYLALWLAGTVVAGASLFLYSADIHRVSIAILGNGSRVAAHLQPFLWAMVTGSAGAVVGAILGFLSHIRSGQDFDRQHVVRFAIQPIMGVVLGILLYTLFSALFAGMQIDITARSITRGLPIVLALPVGLWQEWIYASIYRLMGFFTLRPRRR